ncbi:hypothetical protein AVEN_100577-1 [Araneus ventricosus]|uniref:Uncharacterized protein n=1 Tax=Araneus ventricosus TaxID=182803 RepID=A0A4Y2FF56_ARAVE|nr:hypothetical protein AVEN_100577-1 [Araneus ventricosus]
MFAKVVILCVVLEAAHASLIGPARWGAPSIATGAYGVAGRGLVAPVAAAPVGYVGAPVVANGYGIGAPVAGIAKVGVAAPIEKAFRLLTQPILNRRDVNRSNDIQQMELKKVKECVATYVPHLLANFSDTREADAHFLWSSKENRSFVDSPIFTLGDGLKMTITGGRCECGF